MQPGFWNPASFPGKGARSGQAPRATRPRARREALFVGSKVQGGWRRVWEATPERAGEPRRLWRCGVRAPAAAMSSWELFGETKPGTWVRTKKDQGTDGPAFPWNVAELRTTQLAQRCCRLEVRKCVLERTAAASPPTASSPLLGEPLLQRRHSHPPSGSAGFCHANETSRTR